MPLYVYTTNIPAANNDPSVDQGPMEINTNSIDSLIAEDHYGFNDANGGLHEKVRLPVLGAIPSGTGAGIGTIYTKTAGESEIFFTPDTTTNEYQLTRTITASFGSFGAATNGWTFLPGGLLMQYGSVNAPGSGPTTVNFPVTFTNPPYSIQLTPRNDGSHSAFTYYLQGAPGNSSFQFRGSTSGSQTLFWLAIGK